MKLSETGIHTEPVYIPPQYGWPYEGKRIFSPNVINLFIIVSTIVTIIFLNYIIIDKITYGYLISTIPEWVLLAICLILLSITIYFWRLNISKYLFDKRNRKLQIKYPDPIEYKDYHWDPTGITKSKWGKVVFISLVFLVWLVLLVPFNNQVFFSGISDHSGQAFIAIFDLILLGIFILVIMSILTALKYKLTRLEYQNFPFFIGGQVRLKWKAPSVITNATNITFILRYVEER